MSLERNSDLFLNYPNGGEAVIFKQHFIGKGMKTHTQETVKTKETRLQTKREKVQNTFKNMYK